MPLGLAGEPIVMSLRIDEMDEVGALACVRAYKIGWVRHGIGLVGTSTLGKRMHVR
jgi:hypothetical protein